MKKFVLAFLASLVAACTPVDTTSMEEVYIASVLFPGRCTGTVIEDPVKSDGIQTTILSARHCFGGNKVGDIIETKVLNTLVGFESYSYEKFIIFDISKKSDLAILQRVRGGELPIKPIPIYDGIPRSGTKVYNVSYALTMSPTLTDGYLGFITAVDATSVKHLSLSHLWQRASIDVTGGSSGSSLLIETDVGFQIIGTLTGSQSDDGWITSYWTPVSEIREYLEGLNGS